MNLQEFSELSVKTPNEAKLLLSLLIGHIAPTEDSGKAIISLYDSFFKTYPDKELFSPIINKFFNYHTINEDNIKYYNDYSSMWTPQAIEAIKSENTHWQWDKTEYKNSLEFSKALYAGRNKSCYGFIKKNKETFLKLWEKDKNKLFTNFVKYKIFSLLGREKGYKSLIDFAQEYGFNKNEVVKEAFISSSFDFLHLFEKSNSQQFIYIVNDLSKNKEIFNKYKMLGNRYDERLSNHEVSILDFYFITLANDRIAESFSILDNFLPEIEASLDRYLYNHNEKDLNIYAKLEIVGNYIVETVSNKSSYQHKECGAINAKALSPKLKNLKTYLFKEKLEEEVPKKEIKKIKSKI